MRTEAERLKQAVDTKDVAIECLKMELAKQVEAINMLNRIIDGLSEVARNQTKTIDVYKECTKRMQGKLDS